jgi:DNA mismatch repair protein MutS
MSLVKEYLNYTKQWKHEYGDKTIVLMQVGSFFEVYALRDSEGGYVGSEIEAFSRINDMIIATKTNSCIDNKQVVMAGFGLSQIEKYATKLQAHGYTLVVYTQDVQAKNTSRSLSEIISPGTHFSCEDATAYSNVSMCIWIEHAKATRILGETVMLGVATIDIYTGKTTLFQTTLPAFHNPTTYDDLERLVSIHRPSECLIVSNLSDVKTSEIISFVGLQHTKLHYIESTKETRQNAEKQRYQLETFRRMFPDLAEETINSAILQTHTHATPALVLLLDFVHRHSSHLTRRLEPPMFEYEQNRLLMANHSFKQLNILGDEGKQRSVVALLNNCVTAMGRRQFAYDLLHPKTLVDELNVSYSATESALISGVWKQNRSGLDGILDMERWKRKLIMHRITPKNIATLYHDLLRVQALHPSKACERLLSALETRFHIEHCLFVDDMNSERLAGVPEEHLHFLNDDAIKAIHVERLHARRKLKAFANAISAVIACKEKGAINKHYVKLHETAKSDPLLVVTKRRTLLFRQSPKSKETIPISYKTCDETEAQFSVDMSLITFSANKKDESVQHPLLGELIGALQTATEKMISELQIRFRTHIDELIPSMDDLDHIIQDVIDMDVLQNKCYIAEKFNYCKPEIKVGAKAYCTFQGIRHPLIEHIQTNEVYVTNDLTIGETIDGVLIYGTNAVGKTSFIKSVGIAVVMAQAGLYVPCSSFVFSPYSSLFTRILGNDDLFKGLSTFAVEMSELRAILTGADANSLILGDELCTGTESDSALSIFTAGLETLHDRGCSFLFATHFHEITKYSEIGSLEKLRMMHMAVHYDRGRDCLVYDRKLKDGSGDTMYGLEVCKSLNLPEEFLERAHELRTKYNAEVTGVLSERGSHFNQNKLGGFCEICKTNRGTEVHHLRPQSDANKRNQYIGSMHKNHPANLANVCETCHNRIHKEKLQPKRVKTSNGWSLI